MTIEFFLEKHTENGQPNWNAAHKAWKNTEAIVFSTAKKTKQEKADREKIEKAMKLMSAAFAKLSGDAPEEDDYQFKPTEMKYGKSAGFEWVVAKFPANGTETSPIWPEDKEPWRHIAKAGLTTIGDKWVRMHIVSAQLGGSGTDYSNLIPAPNSVNTGPWLKFEQAVANLPKGMITVKFPNGTSAKIKKVVWLEINVSGTLSAPTKITGNAGFWLWKGEASKWKKEAKPGLEASAQIPAIPKKGEKRKFLINYIGKTEMAEPPFNIKPSIAKKIYENRTYNDDDEVMRKLIASGLSEDVIDKKILKKGPNYGRS